MYIGLCVLTCFTLPLIVLPCYDISLHFISLVFSPNSPNNRNNRNNPSQIPIPHFYNNNNNNNNEGSENTSSDSSSLSHNPNSEGSENCTTESLIIIDRDSAEDIGPGWVSMIWSWLRDTEMISLVIRRCREGKRGLGVVTIVSLALFVAVNIQGVEQVWGVGIHIHIYIYIYMYHVYWTYGFTSKLELLGPLGCYIKCTYIWIWIILLTLITLDGPYMTLYRCVGRASESSWLSFYLPCFYSLLSITLTTLITLITLYPGLLELLAQTVRNMTLRSDMMIQPDYFPDGKSLTPVPARAPRYLTVT